MYDFEDCISRSECYKFTVEKIGLQNISQITNNDGSRTIVGRYYLVKNIENGPADLFIIYLPNYMSDELPNSFTGYGAIMTPEIYFGDQYLFYNEYIEIYLREIKGILFWEGEKSDLIWFYSNPINPGNTINSFLSATIPDEYQYNEGEVVIIQFWSIVSLIFQITFFVGLIYVNMRRLLFWDQQLFLISVYFFILSMFIAPIYTIINADPF